jgi:dihydroorotase
VADILIKGGRVIDPSQNLDKVTDVAVRRGRIESLEKAGKDAHSNFGTVIDAAGKVVCPGLIDMHVHLREPGFEHKETIATGSRAGAAGGFTGMACMPNTNPPIDDAATVKLVLEKASDVNYNVWPIAAVSLGREGKALTEMAELVDSGAIAFSDDGAPVNDSHLMRTALEYSKMLDVPIVQHAEDPELTVLGSMHEGRASALLGVRGMPGIAEDVMVARDILIAEYTGGHLHVAHLSTAASLELVRKAKKRGVHVTCEVTPHHLTLSDEDVRTSGLDPNWKMSPPLRSKEDVRALRKGLKDGTIDLIATDHAPHHLDDKDTTFEDAAFGITGLETALGIILTELVEPGLIDLQKAIALMSSNPADVFNLDAGTLNPGSEANITIFDPQEEWTVDPGQFRSKSVNTPWTGSSLKGKAFEVIVQGRAY